jgi:hypothetical protein
MFAADADVGDVNQLEIRSCDHESNERYQHANHPDNPAGHEPGRLGLETPSRREPRGEGDTYCCSAKAGQE